MRSDMDHKVLPATYTQGFTTMVHIFIDGY